MRGRDADAGPVRCVAQLDASVELDAGDQNVEPTDGFKSLYTAKFGRPFAEKTARRALGSRITAKRSSSAAAPMAPWQDDEDQRRRSSTVATSTSW